MKDITHIDPEVVEACRRRIDDWFEDACWSFGDAMTDIITLAKAHDLMSVKALCDQIGLEIMPCDQGDLLMITPCVKPAFLQGAAVSRPDTAPLQPATGIDFFFVD